MKLTEMNSVAGSGHCSSSKQKSWTETSFVSGLLSIPHLDAGLSLFWFPINFTALLSMLEFTCASFFMFWYTGAAHRNRDIILSVSVAAARAGCGSVQDDSRHEYWRTSKMEIFFSVITCKTALTKAVGFRNVFRIPGRIIGDSVPKEKKKDSLWTFCPNFPSTSPAALFPCFLDWLEWEGV